MTSDEIVARARALIGVPFRPQGRSAALGLDCIGVAAMAMEMDARGDYSLRSSNADEVNGEFRDAGLLRIQPAFAGAGDLLLVAPAPARLHAVVLTPEGYLHADMRLRRTVEVPGTVPWAIVSAWRHPAYEGARRALAWSEGNA